MLCCLSAIAAFLALPLAPASAEPHGGYLVDTFKCDECHATHYAKGELLFVQPDEKQVCYACHDGTGSSEDVRSEFGESVLGTSTMLSLHPVPDNKMKCGGCHTPHTGPSPDNPMSLAVSSSRIATGSAVCGGCHGAGSTLPLGDHITTILGTPHEDSVPAPSSGTRIKCLACHQQHGSPNLALARTQVKDSWGVTETVDASVSVTPLCVTCHAQENGVFPGSAVYGATKHSTVATTSVAATAWPGLGKRNGDCDNCHEPHGKGTGLQYTRVAGNQLCLTCHDSAGTTKPPAYSYQGGAAYARSPHSSAVGVSWKTLHANEKGFAAWESVTPQTPGAPGTAIDATGALFAADGVYARTALADTTGQTDYQMYRFRLADGAAGLQQLKVTWAGYGSAVPGYPVTASVWDRTAGAWLPFASADAPAQTTLTTSTTSPSRFVDGNGYVWVLAQARKSVDAEINGGVTLSAPTTLSVSASWQTLGAASSWVDFGALPPPPYQSTSGSPALSVSHSVTFPVLASGVWHYSVRGTDASGVTRSSADAVFAWPAPSPTPVVTYGTFGSGANVPLSWGENEASRAPYTFRVTIKNGAGATVYSSGWQAAATLTSPFLTIGGYSWQVQAKDTNGVLTPWSVPDAFNVVWEDPYGQAPAPARVSLFAEAAKTASAWIGRALRGLAGEPALLAAPALASEPPLHRSLNTDLVMIETGYSSLSAGGCQQCHAVHGAAGPDGVPYASAESAPEVSNCLGNGSGSCHASAASADGVNVSASVTASSTASTHHDVLPSQQAASGARIKCSDCHNPHKETASNPFSDPSSIGNTVTPETTKYFDAAGSLYVLIGAEHDAVAPVLTNLQIDATTPTVPAFSWATNEPATTWIDWGTTTAYEMGSFGATMPLATSHVATTSVLTPGTTYHYRIRSADAIGNERVTADALYACIGRPSAPSSLNPETTVQNVNGFGVYTFPVSWAPSVGGDADPVVYSVYANGSLVSTTTGTSAILSIDSEHGPGSENLSWYVTAADSGHPYLVSDKSPTGTITLNQAADSCPFLFTWTGKSFEFEADNYVAGRLGGRDVNGYVKANPHDAYVLRKAPAPKDGLWEFRLVEERPEVDYLDSYKLFAVDSPAGTNVYSEKPVINRGYPDFPKSLHTIRGLRPPLSAKMDGRDVLSEVRADDGQRLIVHDGNREADLGYKAVELDLGDVSNAPQVKVVMDAISCFPMTPSGEALGNTFGPRTKLQVQNAEGQWVSVPSTVSALPTPPEYSRPYVFDITKAARIGHKMRFTFLYKTYIDAIGVDTSKDEPVSVQQVPMARADFRWHGIDARTNTSDWYGYDYGKLIGDLPFFPGKYTRYGEVKSLLGETDDKFLILGPGDEVSFSFEPPAEAPPGVSRHLVFIGDGYYKGGKVAVAKTVEPLPFAAMSNFPYAAGEHYPDDAAHQEYLATYNTRYESGLPGWNGFVWRVRNWFASSARSVQTRVASLLSRPKPKRAAAEAVAKGPAAVVVPGTQRQVTPPDKHYSINSDRLVLRSNGLSRGYITYSASAGWESAGASAGPVPSSPGSAVSASMLDGLTTADGSYWRTGLASADKDWNWQVVRFDLTQSERDRIAELRVLWTGYGEPTPGYRTRLAVWNTAAHSWEATSESSSLGSIGQLASSVAAVPASVCLSCHGDYAPSGVVIPANVKDIGPTWLPGPTASFHSAAAASAGVGGGLMAEYRTGKAPDIACATCHDPHGTSNLYHIPTSVKDQTGIVVTNGPSAEALCRACHTGTVHDWHQACSNCHLTTAGPFGHGGDGMTPGSGSDCLACHGHGKSWQHQASDPGVFASEGCHCGVPSYPKTF